MITHPPQVQNMIKKGVWMVKPTIPRDNFGMDATNNYNWRYIYNISERVSQL